MNYTTHDANVLCELAKAAWRTAGPRTRKVRFRYQGRRFVSTLGLFCVHVDIDDGTWPRYENGRVMHLTGFYGFTTD